MYPYVSTDDGGVRGKNVLGVYVIVEQVYSVYKHERSKSIPKPACPSNWKHFHFYFVGLYAVQWKRTV